MTVIAGAQSAVRQPDEAGVPNKPMVPTATNPLAEYSSPRWRRHIGRPFGSYGNGRFGRDAALGVRARGLRGIVGSMERNSSPTSQPATDLGHRGDVDQPQIQALLSLTPTERLRKHEGWRLFVKKALADAELRRTAGRVSR